MMRIDILSLFPGYFRGPFDESLLKRARERGLVEFRLIDIRDYAEGKRLSVDDRTYGGGPGMVMMAEPVAHALRKARREAGERRTRTIYLTPQGRPLTAARCRELAEYEQLILLCGHYEGIDQRVLDSEVEEEISIGDYVLTNGCLPAIVLVDAVMRYVPGVIGDEDAAQQDSFEMGLLEGPQYTRPEVWEGQAVPKVLLEGNHAEIAKWRQARGLAKTTAVRPDLAVRYAERLRQELDSGSSPRDARRLEEQTPKRIVLCVRDLQASRRFYRDRLGLKPIEQSRDALLFRLGSQELMLMQGEPQNVLPLFELRVDDDAILHQLKAVATGYELSQGELEGMKVWFTDPDGYRWVINQR